MKEGFLTVAHAGEEGPPSYIHEALDHLQIKRIDHGVRSLEDSNLLQRIVKEKIPLTVCPLSNVKLGVFQKLSDHNLRTLLEKGARITINSDDPAYFGGYLLENYLEITEALHLSPDQIKTLAAYSFEASFLNADLKTKWI